MSSPSSGDSRISKLFGYPLCKRSVNWMIGLAVVIVLYFIILTTFTKNVISSDMLNTKVFSIPWLENCCSWWPISHVVLYAVLGFFFPDCFVFLMTVGIAWEGMESMAAYFTGRERQKLVTPQSEGSTPLVEYSTNWWAGSTKDVLMNLVGFIIGWVLRKATSL